MRNGEGLKRERNSGRIYHVTEIKSKESNPKIRGYS